MGKKKSFVLHVDYEKHIQRLSMEERGILLTAIFAKESGSPLPSMPPLVEMAFSFIGSQLERDSEKYQDICARNRANGSKGGRPKKHSQKNAFLKTDKTQKSDWVFPKKEPKKTEIPIPFSSDTSENKKTQKPKKPDNDSDSDSDNKNDSDSESDNGGSEEPPHTLPRARTPTLNEIRDYCLERGGTVDPERFFDYYTANGWMAGQVPMQDWRAQIRNWERSEKKREAEKKKADGCTFDEYLTKTIAEEEAKERGRWYDQERNG